MEDNNTTILSSIDDLGRVLIPEKIRENMNLNYNDTVEFFVDNQNIQFRKVKDSCIFCGSKIKLFEFMGKKIWATLTASAILPRHPGGPEKLVALFRSPGKRYWACALRSVCGPPDTSPFPTL